MKPLKRDKLESQLCETIVNTTGANCLSVPEALVLQLLLDQYDLYVKSKTDIDENGAVTVSRGRNGDILKANPSIDLNDKNLKNIINLLRELGVAPQNQPAREVADKVHDGFSVSNRPGG